MLASEREVIEIGNILMDSPAGSLVLLTRPEPFPHRYIQRWIEKGPVYETTFLTLITSGITN